MKLVRFWVLSLRKGVSEKQMNIKITGIYAFYNIEFNKVYVGQSVDVEKRYRQHLKNNNTNTKFYNALRKHGFENFEFRILKECAIDSLNHWERFFQDFYENAGFELYNLKKTNTKDRCGYHSEESKRLMSESRKGEKNHFYGKKRPDHSAKISGVNHHFYGVKGKDHPSFGTDRSGENGSMFGKKHSPEAIQKIKDNKPDQTGERNPMFGKKHSPETIEKMKKYERPNGENSFMFGKKHSPETIEKMRKKASNRPKKQWINNGIERHLILADDLIPEGYQKGSGKGKF